MTKRKSNSCDIDDVENVPPVKRAKDDFLPSRAGEGSQKFPQSATKPPSSCRKALESVTQSAGLAAVETQLPEVMTAVRDSPALQAKVAKSSSAVAESQAPNSTTSASEPQCTTALPCQDGETAGTTQEVAPALPGVGPEDFTDASASLNTTAVKGGLPRVELVHIPAEIAKPALKSLPRAGPEPVVPEKERTKVQKEIDQMLDLLAKMSTDIWHEVAKYLPAEHLIILDQFPHFKSGNGPSIWNEGLKKYTRLPRCPSWLEEAEYYKLVLSRRCDCCGFDVCKTAILLVGGLRKFCSKCFKKGDGASLFNFDRCVSLFTASLPLRLVEEILRARDIVVALVPIIRDAPTRGGVPVPAETTNYRPLYFRGDVEEAFKAYIRAKRNNAEALQTHIAERKENAAALMKLAHELNLWAASVRLDTRAEKKEARKVIKIRRRRSVLTRIAEMGFLAEEYPQTTEWKKWLETPKPLTERSWNSKSRALRAYIEREREGEARKFFQSNLNNLCITVQKFLELPAVRAHVTGTAQYRAFNSLKARQDVWTAAARRCEEDLISGLTEAMLSKLGFQGHFVYGNLEDSDVVTGLLNHTAALFRCNLPGCVGRRELLSLPWEKMRAHFGEKHPDLTSPPPVASRLNHVGVPMVRPIDVDPDVVEVINNMLAQSLPPGLEGCDFRVQSTCDVLARCGRLLGVEQNLISEELELSLISHTTFAEIVGHTAHAKKIRDRSAGAGELNPLVSEVKIGLY